MNRYGNHVRKLIPRVKLSLVDIETLEGQGRMEITSGVAQRSILGPDLWNASWDSLRRLDMPENSRLVGYADDVAALVVGRTVEETQSRLGILMRWVSGWMTVHGFSLALEKNPSSYLDEKENPDPAFDELTIESKPAIKYLGRLEDELLRANQSSSRCNPICWSLGCE